jgi:predicted HNH restriction endonuclease
MSRRKFIESQGATCNNWQTSWSFINQDKRFVVFGEWQNRENGMIFSEDWEFRNGRLNNGYKQSREHIRLVEEEGYKLMTFPMYATAESALAPRPHIQKVEERLFERTLVRNGRNWFAAGEPIPSNISRSTWIFQGNPKLYDIDDYLARYPLIYWRTPTHRDHIALGDRAFMWRAGDDGGIVASGHVVELPVIEEHLKHPEALGSDLWMADELAKRRMDPNAPKVGIAIDSVRLTAEEGMVPRSFFKGDPQLSQSTIIRQPNSTVFAVSTEEALKLEEVWGGSASLSGDPIEAFALEGDRRVTSHRRRERSRFLVNKKLKEARSRGPIRCEVCCISEDSFYPKSLSARIFEVHHLQPLAVSDTPVRTTLQDLAIVCANCHRAIHATREVEENLKLLKREMQQR